MNSPCFLLVGPYDPSCGEYTFLSPPLGVWRLAGFLRESGYVAEVFDPNLEENDPRGALAKRLRSQRWDVIGFSTTGMTLPYDLSLAHEARRLTDSVLVAGGMEATFRPELLLDIGPFDFIVLGEGEKPLRAMAERLTHGAAIRGIEGTAFRDRGSGALVRRPQLALDREELKSAIFQTPYSDMPYRAYWERLQDAYRIGALPFKADREARLSEIRSVRFATLNYCPMGCTFCSSTNFLHAAQGSKARVSRLTAPECLDMVTRIVHSYPDVRTIIFQDDIFVFTQDDRIAPLCNGILAAKSRGEIPSDLEFISTNRIDSMTTERLTLMKQAGFRVLGFGVESFSTNVLREFNKARIAPYITPVLESALELGLTPFLDIILASPRSTMSDLVTTLRRAYRWLVAGCEVGMYPYVIPFSGAAMAEDPAHEPVTVRERSTVVGTGITWSRPMKILPHDEEVRNAILETERAFETLLSGVSAATPHVPSRVRSLLWILGASAALGEEHDLPSPDDVSRLLSRWVPVSTVASEARRGGRLVEAATHWASI
jgi:radical SAM superfamily enzyme YgiQ (UPF0313 family)